MMRDDEKCGATTVPTTGSWKGKTLRCSKVPGHASGGIPEHRDDFIDGSCSVQWTDAEGREVSDE
jgi:hypothetical protein